MPHNLLKKLLRPFCLPLVNTLADNLTPSEVWRCEQTKINGASFAKANLHSWNWYFEGTSKTEFNTLNEVVCWLRNCTYVPDYLLFNEDDFWQHPLTFERIRQGDCEDHALWTWRKLCEMGYKTEFVCGMGGPMTERKNRGHAWVHVVLGDEKFLMETTAKKFQRMTFRISKIERLYCPGFSVDQDLNTHQYGGGPELLRSMLNSSE